METALTVIFFLLFVASEILPFIPGIQANSVLQSIKNALASSDAKKDDLGETLERKSHGNS